MNTSSFEPIVRIQVNALMMTVIKCTVKSRKRQLARGYKREVLFCELSDTKQVEWGTTNNYSCDYISFGPPFYKKFQKIRKGKNINLRFRKTNRIICKSISII